MPRQSGTVVNNTLVKGLITEATGVNFPEGACTRTFDCIFEKTGKVTRRPAFRLETDLDPPPSEVVRNDSYVSEFVWETVGGDGDLTFVVVQYNKELHFFKLVADGNLSDQERTFDVNLNNYRPAGSVKDTGTRPCQYTAGKGHLFVTHAFTNPIYIEYDADADSITVHEIDIEIRDFEGLEDDLEVDERPSAITDEHRYNLYNQGWGQTCSDTGGSMVVAYDEWDSNLADFPSNADIWWIMKDIDGNFDTVQRNDIPTGNTPAPKGHYVLEAFNLDREAALEADTAAAHTIATVDSDTQRPAACAFFSGRVWFGGVNHKKYADKIYFSQIIERDEQIGSCYQQNDPTSEHQSDLLPSDGGVISIPDIGFIYKLIPIQDAILVFGANGVWAVQGSEGLGFRANDYSINKISGVPTRSATSFVTVEGLPIYWTLSGIYTVSVGQSGALTIDSISDNTIQSFFDEIPASSRLIAKGAYNPLTKVVQWIYKEGHAEGLDNKQNYSGVLNFNTETAAFYPWRIGTDGRITVNGIICIENVLGEEAAGTKFYYLTSEASGGTNYQFYFATCEGTDYLDWGEESYESHLFTGYSLQGQGNKDFQTNYITVYIENDDETNSLLVRGAWDYARNADQVRWSTAQECYNFQDADDFAVVFRRLKIRGRGKVVQLRFGSTEGLPFNLIGWSTQVSSNAAP